MLRSQEVIFANLCKIRAGDKVVVMERLKQDWPGVAFPGGHVERGESIVSSVIRGVKEEIGLTVSNLELCGIQNWTDPIDHYRYLVFCCKTSYFQSLYSLLMKGGVFWIDCVDLKDVHSWKMILGTYQYP